MKGSKFNLKIIKYIRKQGNKIIKTEAVMIVIKDEETGKAIPHPSTHFLYKNYHRNSGSINTEMAAAYVIVPFLNFVWNKVQEGNKDFQDVNGLMDLKVEHANLYLQSCVKEKANLESTLDKKENYISKFYKYLLDEKVLKYKPNFKVSSIPCNNGIRAVHKLDFTYKKTDTAYVHSKIKRKDIVPQGHQTNENRHIIRLHYIREILLVAKQEVPDIAFAVALQIFGGLRKGEVVNLFKSSLKPQNGVPYGEGGLVVEVRDRQNVLFHRFNDISKEQVKRPRDQSCFIDPILCYLYKHHVEKVLKKINNTKYPDALFYNEAGNPMSADSFDKKFLKLKNIYLGMLLATKGRYQDYLDFSQTKWRSHIGRGVFTNMCMDAGFNEKQTAILRGDKSTKSMESYFDIITATYNIRKALGLLSPEQSSKIASLNMPFYQRQWKDVEEFGSRI